VEQINTIEHITILLLLFNFENAPDLPSQLKEDREIQAGQRVEFDAEGLTWKQAYEKQNYLHLLDKGIISVLDPSTICPYMLPTDLFSILMVYDYRQSRRA
jgi:hypothetical protein